MSTSNIDYVWSLTRSGGPLHVGAEGHVVPVAACLTVRVAVGVHLLVFHLGAARAGRGIRMGRLSTLLEKELNYLICQSFLFINLFYTVLMSGYLVFCSLSRQFPHYGACV